MDEYRELRERLSGLQPRRSYLYQGVVQSVEGLSCTVLIDGLAVPDVRLRATMTQEGEELLIRPALGSGAIVGSLTGELDQLVLLMVDKAEELILHGGSQGGLVLVGALCKRLNTLERALNELKQTIAGWTPTPQDGGLSLKAQLTAWTSSTLPITKERELENPKIRQ